MRNNNFIDLAGFSILETSSYDLAGKILKRMGESKKSLLFFANTNFIVQCQSIKSRFNSSDIHIVNDGVGMDIASYLLYRRKFEANLNGTDFTPYFFENINKSLRLFLVGGKSEVLSKATYYFEHHLGQVVSGACDGYEGVKNPNLVNEINELSVDVVLVAMGNPKQEEWILDNYPKLNAHFIVGVGALFDFVAGDKSRAPALIRQIRAEWLYRLCLEPKRLAKRYTIDVMQFLYICLKHHHIKASLK